MNDIVMPRLSDSMTEGTVVRWLKHPGDRISRGEPLVEVETDKATITYESDLDGVITEILVGEGETAAVGMPIAFVDPVGAQAAPPQQAQPQPGSSQAPPQFQPPQPPPAQSSPPAPPPSIPAPAPSAELLPDDFRQDFDDYEVTDEHDQFASEPGERVKASPIAKRLAAKLGVDIEQVAGSGPGGRVVKEDVEAAADEAARRASAQHEPTQSPAPPPLPAPAAEPPYYDDPAQTGEFESPSEYAYEPGGTELDEDLRFEEGVPLPAAEDPFVAPQSLPAPLPIDPEPAQPLAPAAQAPTFEQPQAPQPPPLQQDPPLIPNFPAPPAAAPIPQQPIYGAPGQAPQPGYAQPAQAPPPGYAQPQQFPSPAPFVQGMTGGFPAITPPGVAPQQQMPQAPQFQQPQFQQPAPQQPMPQQFQQQPYQQPVPQQPQPQQFQPPQPPPVEQAGASTATRGHSTPIEPTAAQQTVARRMAESKATAPEFFVETEVDMTTCVAYREQLRSVVSPLPSFNDFVIKAAAQALRQYPSVNAAYKDGHFEQYSDVNVGVVVSATELLAVPTLFNVDQKGLAQIAAESQQLSDAVRSRSIQPGQLSGGTFSVSNLGMYGVDRFTAILNPPQAAILAVGAINRRAVIAEDGMSLVIRQIMTMTLTCDHRILYGAEAAEFLGAIKAWLESPQLLQV